MNDPATTLRTIEEFLSRLIRLRVIQAGLLAGPAALAEEFLGRSMIRRQAGRMGVEKLGTV